MATSDIEQSGWRWRIWHRRKRQSAEASLPALAEYHSLDRHFLRNFLGISALLFFLLIYGFFFSAFAPAYFAFFMMPLIALGFLVIWALPEVNWAPTKSLEIFFFALFVGMIIWPNYLAIALPGLPWITVVRLTSFPLNLILLACISMSADFRADMLRSLRSVPAIPVLLGIFVVIQLLSIGLSKDVSNSIQKFIVAQTTWTATFFAAAYIFRHPGRFKRWAMIMWAMAIFVSFIAIWEAQVRHVVWLGHIPGFLKVNDDAVQAILAGNMRSGTNIYRAQSTFSTPLGLAEYLALSVPFVLHFATKRFSRNTRLAAVVSLPVILYACVLTNAKLGTIGSLAAILLYVFGVSFQYWRREKQSLIAAASLLSYPLLVALVGGAMLASHRFSVLIIGNDGSHAASTEGRIEQYTTGFHKFLEWPFGYGIGMGAITLGFNRGMLSIDTYYLSVLLEYGIAGFIIYYGMFAIAIYEAGRRSLFAPSDTEDRTFTLPIAVSLVTFIIIKSVFSQQDNHPVVFMMLGALMAIVGSYRGVPSRTSSNMRPVPGSYRLPQGKTSSAV